MATSQSPSLRVLVVDGDEATHHLYRDVLQAAGYQVVGATSGMDAVIAATRATACPDAIILEYVLPDMTGGTLMDLIRPVCGNLPVLLITVRDDASDLAGAIGAAEWFIKPVAVMVVVGRLGGLLAYKR